MVYEKLLLLIVAAATKWRVAFLIDIYIYIYTYIKNVRHVRKRKYDEKTVGILEGC